MAEGVLQRLCADRANGGDEGACRDSAAPARAPAAAAMMDNTSLVFLFPASETGKLAVAAELEAFQQQRDTDSNQTRCR
jgi:hypothetical protein